MMMNTSSRREFVRRSLSVAAMAGAIGPVSSLFGEAPVKTRRPRSLRLGAPSVAKTEDPEELARAYRSLGYRAAICPKVPLDDAARIKATTAAFASHDVVLAEVGRWVNLLDADPEKRRNNLQTVTEGLALADEIGALCCVDIAGSFNATSWFGPHPDNLSPRFFDAAVENARKIIDAVKPKRARFCYEMMGWSLPDGPDAYVKMIRAVDRPAFAAHLDPCNVVNSPERFYRNGDLINECFDKLGGWIVSCHAKDLVWDVEMNVHFREVGPGKGSIDYDTYLRRLAHLPHEVPLILEHLPNADEYTKARLHLFAKAGELGLGFQP